MGLTASTSLAQPTGGTPGGTAGGVTTGGTAGGVTTGGGGMTGGTGGGGGGGGGQVGSGFGQPQLVDIQAPPPITEVSLYSTGARAGGADPSNVFARTYVNPMWAGRAGAAIGEVPGGFGAPLYQTTGAGGAGGRFGVTTGVGGVGGAGGFGRAGSLTGAGGFGRTGGILGGAGTGGLNQTGVVVQMPRAIAYPAQVRFPAPAVAPTRLQTDLRGILDSTPMLATPGNVQLQVDGSNVTLRGTVRDREEARLVEGLIRLTPGVRVIRNELTFPAQ